MQTIFRCPSFIRVAQSSLLCKLQSFYWCNRSALLWIGSRTVRAPLGCWLSSSWPRKWAVESKDGVCSVESFAMKTELPVSIPTVSPLSHFRLSDDYIRSSLSLAGRLKSRCSAWFSIDCTTKWPWALLPNGRVFRSTVSKARPSWYCRGSWLSFLSKASSALCRPHSQSSGSRSLTRSIQCHLQGSGESHAPCWSTRALSRNPSSCISLDPSVSPGLYHFYWLCTPFRNIWRLLDPQRGDSASVPSRNWTRNTFLPFPERHWAIIRKHWFFSSLIGFLLWEIVPRPWSPETSSLFLECILQEDWLTTLNIRSSRAGCWFAGFVDVPWYSFGFGALILRFSSRLRQGGWGGSLDAHLNRAVLNTISRLILWRYDRHS